MINNNFFKCFQRDSLITIYSFVQISYTDDVVAKNT